MRFFDPDSYLGVSVHAHQAVEIASVSDAILKKATFAMFGKYDSRRKLYYDFSSVQKANDTHVILSFAPKVI